MAEFHEISPNAPASAKLLNWVDNRFPLTKLWNDQWGKYYCLLYTSDAAAKA